MMQKTALHAGAPETDSVPWPLIQVLLVEVGCPPVEVGVGARDWVLPHLEKKNFLRLTRDDE